MPLPNAQADRTSALRPLIDTLFDFEALPGRYPLSLREPRILFDGSHDVLLLAAGRPVEGLAFELTDMPRAKRAACFFVRTAMLRPGSDHYTVLGLEQGFSKNSLRLHYRILIRLTHPDFVGNSEAWPTGSATRINLAHDVLSSPTLQAEYNRTLSGNERRRVLPVQSLAAVLPRPAAKSNQLFNYKPWALVSSGVFGLLLLATLWPGNSDDSHVRQVAQIELPNSLVLAGKGSEDLKANLSRDNGVAASRQALEGRQVQVARALREAKEAEIAKLQQVDKLEQLAQEAKVARLAQSAKAAQDAKTAEVAQAAALNEVQLSHEATLARAKLAAIALQTASEAHAAMLLVQAAKAAQAVQANKLAIEEKTAKLAQAALEIKAAKSTQLARSIQEPQVALAAQTPRGAEVLLTDSVSTNGMALPVKLLPAQPVNDTAAKLSLVDVQPALNQLIQSMQAGRGEDLLRGLERSVSRSGGASDLVNAYNVLIGGSRAVRVGRVQLRSRPAADQLTVDGVVQLILQDQGQPLPVRELQLRAAFVLRDGQVVMTELSTSGSRP